MDTSTNCIVLPCENCIISQQGAISIINVFLSISVNSLPTSFTFFAYGVVIGWLGSREFTLEIRNPEGGSIDKWSGTFQTQDVSRPIHIANRFECEFLQYGEHWVELYIEGKVVSRSSFIVQQR